MARIKAVKNSTKKEVIINKAGTLFRKSGYRATSMRQIAGHVGVEAPSLYNHIKSKSDILQSICMSVSKEFCQQRRQVEKMQATDSLKVEQLVRLHIQKMTQHFDMVFVANHEWKNLKEPFLSEFVIERRQYENFLIKLISNAIKAKEFRTLQPKVAAISILYTLRSIEYWKRNSKNLNNNTLEDDIVNHLLYGLIQ